MWQRRTVCRSWVAQKRPHSQRLWPRTIVNSQRTRSTPGSSANSARNWAKSTCPWRPGAVSKRRSKGLGLGGWPRLAQEVGQDAVAALVAELADLAQQALAGQLWPGGDPLAQVGLVRREPVRPRRS